MYLLIAKELQWEWFGCSCPCCRYVVLSYLNSISNHLSNKLYVFKNQHSHYFFCCLWITWCLSSLCSFLSTRMLQGLSFQLGCILSLKLCLFRALPLLFHQMGICQQTYPEEDLESYANTCNVLLQPCFP